ncbi:MAG: TlpA family protein disulfide reductase [Gemmatimonadetes bacterium]|nr:TlpA family protein disulfide reductase [Gemmatimonadota bacterium]
MINRTRVASGFAWGLRLALAVTTFSLAVPSESRAQDVGLPLGTQAPTATLQDLDGNSVEILNYVKGKPTLLEFWAMWCEICESLQPQVDQIHSTYGDRLNVVAVAVGVSQTPRRIKQHLGEHGARYPYLFDVRGAAVRAYKVPTTSVVVIVDGNGKVAYTGSGAEQDLVGAVRKILGS